MSRNDWSRKTTWTEADRTDFFNRLARGRSHNAKAQYLHLQAATFFDTGLRERVEVALSLLQKSFDEFPGAMACALSYELAAKCLLFLDRPGDAVEFLRKALRREEVFPGIVTNAELTLGWAAVERGLSHLYEEVITSLDKKTTPPFVVGQYMANAIRAIIAAENGDPASARRFAQAALEASSKQHSGLSRHPTVGLVRNLDTPVHERLVRLAAFATA